jgi:uncharacterized protein YjbI with pentapeptide repeats
MGDSTNTEESSDGPRGEDADPVGLSEALEGPDSPTGPADVAEERSPPASALGIPWPNRLQEILIASIGATGATITASMLAGSGSSVETLERLSVLFCGLAALSTWFVPPFGAWPRINRLGSWAAVAVVLYWLGPIRIAEIRGEHDLAQGTRSEKEAAVERLVRLGRRDLGGADLRELNLSDADLTNLNLVGANLSHSTLERALLLESDLSSSDLSGANFRGANLTSAKLEGAKFGASSDATRCDRFTQLPEGYQCLHGAMGAKSGSK